MSRKAAYQRARRARLKAAAATAASPAQMTQEQVLAHNIKAINALAKRGLMPREAVNIGGTAEHQTKIYETIDQAYKRMPEGYSYTFLDKPVGLGEYRYMERHYQILEVYHIEQRNYQTGKIDRIRRTRGIGSPQQIPKNLQSQSAIRGYAKAQTFYEAGKIYDPQTKLE